MPRNRSAVRVPPTMKRAIFALGLTGCRLVSAASSAEDRALLYVTVRTTGDLRSQRLPEATVTIRTLREQVIATVRTDSNGRATLDLPVGIYDAIASATGFQNQTIHVEAFAGQAAIVFSLVPAPAMEPLSEREPAGFAHAAISGLVLTLQGEPVTNAVVTLTGPTYDETIVETAPDGSFRAVVSMPAPDGHPPAITIVTDYAEVATPVSISPGFESKGVVLHVSSHPEFRLTVTVRDATGRVPPGTEVSASSTWTGSVRESHLSVFPVPPDGAVTFGSLRSGSVTIWALTKTTTPSLAAATRIVIGDRPPDDVFMLLLPSARLTGRVEFSDSDQPIRRASLFAWWLPFQDTRCRATKNSIQTASSVRTDHSSSRDSWANAVFTCWEFPATGV